MHLTFHVSIQIRSISRDSCADPVVGAIVFSMNLSAKEEDKTNAFSTSQTPQTQQTHALTRQVFFASTSFPTSTSVTRRRSRASNRKEEEEKKREDAPTFYKNGDDVCFFPLHLCCCHLARQQASLVPSQQPRRGARPRSRHPQKRDDARGEGSHAGELQG